MNLATADRRKLGALLDELARAVEELLLSGLTTASAPTRQALDVAFQEASRMKLLRLGATLRSAAEELGRFTRQDPLFSRRRLCFFLGRAWMLCQGLTKALRENNDTAFERLLRLPTGAPVERLEVVTLGVAKKVTLSFCAFEFRLRTITSTDTTLADARLIWSYIPQHKPRPDIPAEAFLHEVQKQKFKPSLFLEGNLICLEHVVATRDDFGGARISLTEKSQVSPGPAFTDWGRFQRWDAALALQRLRSHQPGPFDLAVEMQENIVLTEWSLGEPIDRDNSSTVYPIQSGHTTFEAVVAKTVEGEDLRQALDALSKSKDRPPLFGLLHYEMCKLVLQPLALFGKGPPKQLMLSQKQIGPAALLRLLKF